MYPVFRFAWQFFLHRNDPPLGLFDTHLSAHVCWPWDLDFWMELNNGRTLTLYDLARLPLAKRAGMIAAVRRRGWGLTVAGTIIRYRRRIRAFDRYTMRSRCIGWDSRFIYIEQSMWTGSDDCASHAVLRMATVGPKGIVEPALVAQEMGYTGAPPALPEWVLGWSEVEARRPWPPMQD
jgi:acyl-CoA thioesterase FadM